MMGHFLLAAVQVVPSGHAFACTPTRVWDGDGPVWCAEGPRLGTLPGGIYFPAALARSIYNLASRGTGMGITRNIIECHAALIRSWRPVYRIFLFGFSRAPTL